MRKVLSTIMLALSTTAMGQITNAVDRMWQQFNSVPDDARTKVWWWHGDARTTREGITADLEAFKRAGVGSVVYYDQIHGDGASACDAFSEEWWQMFVFAAQEAHRVGLGFETHVGNGFVAGGPWIQPDEGMKMLVMADTVITGGCDMELRQPALKKSYKWKGEVAVMAFPFKGDNDRMLVSKNTVLKAEGGKHNYLVADMGKSYTARSLTYYITPRGRTATRGMNTPGPAADSFYAKSYTPLPSQGELEASDDGKTWRKVCDIKPIYASRSVWIEQTISFKATTARFFRLNLHDWWTENERGDARNMTVKYARLSPAAKADLWEEKSGLVSNHIFGNDTPDFAADEVVKAEDIVDLTSRVDANGRIHWQAPKGQWRIVRFVCVPTGARSRHGRKNLLGLECDKMSAAVAEKQWNNYFKVMLDTLRNHDLTINNLVMDSHEAGAQNWTMGFEREFEQLRGYSLMRFLPVMAGYVVDSRERTDGVLYDVRRTIADLISDRYYATLHRLTNCEGVGFSAQAIGNGLCIVGDPIMAKGRTDAPEGEFWITQPDGNYDIKESSSAAHIYGKPLASAEAFTGIRYIHTLADLKNIADNAWAMGINQFVVCASPHQPWVGRFPGNTCAGHAYSLTRTNTYWPYSKGFWDYQGRVSYMMRQGMPVVDFCVYLGGNAPIKIETYRLPQIPEGTDFDAFTTDALLTQLHIEDGNLCAAAGMTYSMMVLPREGVISLRALRKIERMVRAGMKVYGAKPVATPSTADKDSLSTWQALVDDLWGATPAAQGSRSYGQGHLWWGMPLAEAAREAGIRADIALGKGRVDYKHLTYAHRRTAGADIYFINNHSADSISDSFAFRTTKKHGEWWNALDGSRKSIVEENRQHGDGLFSAQLTLGPKETAVLVFCNDSADIPAKTWSRTERMVNIDGPWQVTFDEERGGPGIVTFNQLIDWTTSAEEGIKYYSGTAVYEKKLKIAKPKDGQRVVLCFDKLADVARVIVNGHDAGTLWCAPYELDITPYIKKGGNTLRLEVTNTLMNRMIRDAALPEAERVTYAFPVFVSPDDKLRPSGVTGGISLLYR